MKAAAAVAANRRCCCPKTKVCGCQCAASAANLKGVLYSRSVSHCRWLRTQVPPIRPDPCADQVPYQDWLAQSGTDWQVLIWGRLAQCCTAGAARRMVAQPKAAAGAGRPLWHTLNRGFWGKKRRAARGGGAGRWEVLCGVGRSIPLSCLFFRFSSCLWILPRSVISVPR